MPVVIITGSNSGFGFSGALAFAREGYTVYATMREVTKCAKLQQVVRDEKLPVIFRSLDITKPKTFATLIDGVIAEQGRVDVLVNNAGILHPGTAEETPEELLRLVMETNFFGPVLLTKILLPHMRRQGSGRIIMVSSLSGIAGLPGDFPYTASKFALEGATEAMRHEVDRWGIYVALVEASTHKTDIFKTSTQTTTETSVAGKQTSPYGGLLAANAISAANSLSRAPQPEAVGKLFVEIARSNGSRLRWPADPLSDEILTVLFGKNDRARDEYLQNASNTHWWSEGKEKP